MLKNIQLDSKTNHDRHPHMTEATNIVGIQTMFSITCTAKLQIIHKNKNLHISM